MIKRSKKAKKTATRRGGNTSGAGWMKQGNEVTKETERINAEKERKAEQRKRTGGVDPNRSRFWLPRGKETELVVLDDQVDTVAFYEHGLKKDGKWGNYESCCGEWSNCPLCASGDNKAFVWFLTVLDCTGFTKDDGTEVPYYRKLLPIKSSQANNFKRVLKAAVKQHGTCRGVVLTVERDTGDKAAAIGEPVINDEGSMFEFMDEDDLIEEFGHAALKNKDGDVYIKKNGLLQPFDYDAVFPKPDAADIAKRWGLASPAGSDDEYEKLKAEEDDYEEEEEEEEEEADDEHPFIRIAEVADAKGSSRNKSLDSAAEEYDIDPDDFDSWVEVAEAIILAQDESESDPESEDGIQQDWAAYGADLDEEDDDDSEDTLLKAAEDLGVDVDDYDTWEDVGAAMNDALTDEDEEEPPKKAKKGRKLKRSRTIATNDDIPF